MPVYYAGDNKRFKTRQERDDYNATLEPAIRTRKSDAIGETWTDEPAASSAVSGVDRTQTSTTTAAEADRNRSDAVGVDARNQLRQNAESAAARAALEVQRNSASAVGDSLKKRARSLLEAGDQEAWKKFKSANPSVAAEAEKELAPKPTGTPVSMAIDELRGITPSAPIDAAFEDLRRRG